MIGGQDQKERDIGEPPAGTPHEPAPAGLGEAAEGAPSPEQQGGALAALRAENDALKDRLLRALAETENLRRRGERDLDDARRYAVTRFARDLLPVADNMERAMASVGEPAQHGEGKLAALVEGVELTGKELLRVLEKHGIRKLVPVGERFDPHFHEALFEIPDPAVPDGTVGQVLEPGYAIGTRALRPAKVGVARGGPPGKAAPSGAHDERP